MKRPIKIGLTGTIGSGKTAAANLFQKLGAPVIDTDQIAHQLTQKNSPALKKIAGHFSEKILLPSGELNRKKLRDIIFQNSAEKKWLENFLHPLILTEMNRQIKNISAPYVILVIPLLFEAHCESYVDRTCTVDADEKTKVTRVCKRDHLTPDEVSAILKTQICREEQLKKSDDVINNNGDLDSLEIQVKNLHKKYLSQS